MNKHKLATSRLANVLMIAALALAVSLVDSGMDRIVPAALRPLDAAPTTAVAVIVIALFWSRRLRARSKEREALVIELEVARAEMERLSVTDQLTGLLNRRGFEGAFLHEAACFERTGVPFCLAVVDVNDMKVINDTLGHAEGDRVLQATAAALSASIRRTDIAARTGGDEFAVILTGCSDATGECFIGRLSTRIAEVQEAGDLGAFSVSVGVTSSTEGVVGMYERADARMFEAKSSGVGRALVSLPRGELISPDQPAA